MVRNNPVIIKFDLKEKEVLRQDMELVGMKTMSEYIRFKLFCKTFQCPFKNNDKPKPVQTKKKNKPQNLLDYPMVRI